MEGMKEYIERAALKRELAPYEENDFSQQMDVILAIVDAQPTADVAPVRHGRWLPQIVLGKKAWDCSECKTLGSPHWKWCPMCGAMMDGKESDHEAD